MKRKVFVSVTGVDPAGSHSVSGGAGTEEVLPDGTHVIRFREEMEGAAAPLTTAVTLTENALLLTREGELTCRLTFEAGREVEGLYRMPFGAVPLKTYTRHLRVRFSERETFAALSYDLRFADGTAEEGCRVSVRASVLHEER